jgi:2',3'-cyclic-nucleotide 2'-phosphodiesterase/3'-nucleotidase
MTNRFRRLALAVVALLLAAVLVGAAAPQPGIVRLDILAINDFHGALAAADRNPGAAALAAYLKAERAKNPAGTLVLSAGDMFQGSPDSNLLYGKTVVAFMNEVGFDAMALGNHEFDWGLDILRSAWPRRPSRCWPPTSSTRPAAGPPTWSRRT